MLQRCVHTVYPPIRASGCGHTDALRRAAASPHWVSIGLLLYHPNCSGSGWGDATAAFIQTQWGDATARRGSTLHGCCVAASVFPASPFHLHPCFIRPRSFTFPSSKTTNIGTTPHSVRTQGQKFPLRHTTVARESVMF